MLQFLVALFGPKRCERGGHMYERLGVHLVRRVMPFGPYFNRVVRGLLGKREDRVVKDQKSAQSWVVFTMVAEAFHVLFFCVFLGLMGAAVVNHSLQRAGWILVANLIINAYPIMVQRYVRQRLLHQYQLDLQHVSHWQL